MSMNALKSDHSSTSTMEINPGVDLSSEVVLEESSIGDVKTSSRCARVGCGEINATKYCGQCENVVYCSRECQREHWASHKQDCEKKNTDPLICFSDAWMQTQEMIKKAEAEVAAKDDIKAIKTLRQALAHAEHQFGKPELEKLSRDREDSDDRISSWEIDNMVMRMCTKLGDLNKSLGTPDGLRNAEIFYIRGRRWIEMWRKRLDGRVNGERLVAFDAGQENLILHHLARAELNIVHTMLAQGDVAKAEKHAAHCLQFSSRVKEEHCTSLTVNPLYEAISAAIKICELNGQHRDVALLAEQGWSYAEKIHGPEHGKVQTMAEILINNLMLLEDYTVAEKFARRNYEVILKHNQTKKPAPTSTAAARPMSTSMAALMYQKEQEQLAIVARMYAAAVYCRFIENGSEEGPRAGRKHAAHNDSHNSIHSNSPNHGSNTNPVAESGYTGTAAAVLGDEDVDTRPLMKIADAEQLALCALRTMENQCRHTIGEACMGPFVDTYASILLCRQKIDPATRQLLERFLGISLRHEGMEGINTMKANDKLGTFYFLLAHTLPTDGSAVQLSPADVVELTRSDAFFRASCFYDEALRISTHIYGSNHKNTTICRQRRVDALACSGRAGGAGQGKGGGKGDEKDGRRANAGASASAGAHTSGSGGGSGTAGGSRAGRSNDVMAVD